MKDLEKEFEKAEANINSILSAVSCEPTIQDSSKFQQTQTLQSNTNSIASHATQGRRWEFQLMGSKPPREIN